MTLVDRVGKEVIYNTIETLLPKSIHPDGKTLRLMELYADPESQRTGWISVAEEEQQSIRNRPS